MQTYEFIPGRHADYTPPVRLALAAGGAARLHFAPGRYDFYPERAYEELVFAPGHEPGLRRIAFPVLQRQDVVIEGEGASFIFHGRILPFVLRDSARLSLRGFSVDWAKPFYLEAQVLNSPAGSVVLEFVDSVSRNAALATLPGTSATIPRPWKILQLDARRAEIALGTGEQCLADPALYREACGATALRLSPWPRETVPSEGQKLLIFSSKRELPALFAVGCQDLEIQRLNIHHSEGAGCLMHFCRNIHISSSRVVPTPSGERLLSTLGEAFAVVHCRGRVVLDSCTIENSGSSGAKIYSLGLVVASMGSPMAVEGRFRPQHHHGAHLAASGEKMELRDGESLAPFATGQIISFARLNSEFLRLQTSSALSRSPRPGDLITFPDWAPQLHIRSCLFRGTASHGLEIHAASEAIVEDCTFHTGGAALSVGSDPLGNGEAGVVEELIFERNRILTCGLGKGARAAVQSLPELAVEHRPSTVWHGLLRFRQNIFQVFDPRLLAARCTGKIEFCDNRVVLTAEYPIQNPGAPPWTTECCGSREIHSNSLAFPMDESLQELAAEMVDGSQGGLSLELST